MPYNLFVIWPGKEPRKTLRSPYPIRQDTASTVRMIAIGAPPYNRELAARLAEKVITAPLGEMVTIDGTDASFRTEETT